MSDLFSTGVRPAINDFIDTKRKETRDYGDYWSASAAGYCMRKAIFERMKIPHVTELDERTQRVFEVGNIFHEWVQGITKEAGLSIASEVELQDEELMIRGHFDDLVLVPEMTKLDTPITWDTPESPKHLILYDYKTAHSKSFHYSKGRPMSHYHKMQLGTYMYMLRNNRNIIDKADDNARGIDLVEARILKISKDDLVMEEKQLMWSEGLEKEIVGYWKTLNGYWNAKKLPACTCADYEGGFMANERYNPFYYEGEPCSLAWYELNKPVRETL